MSGRLEIVPLGGLGEFGRNLMWIRAPHSGLIVDAGVSFPDESFPGIDRIAPDLSALRGEPIAAVLLTHGHEDHIGALPYLREWCEAPVYGLPFTLAMARRRLEEAGVSESGLIEVKSGERRVAGAFSFSFFRVSHSVPDSAAIWIESGGITLLHSGDFKVDADPPDGETTDWEGLRAAVGSGVDLALVDSTNAQRPGRSGSEREAGRGLAAAFAGARGRIVLTTFSSHVARVAQAAEAAVALGRRVAFLGRSVRAVAEIAERMGRLRLPAGARPSGSDLSNLEPRRLLCVTSGSQGEPFSALYRLALEEHPDLSLSPGDLVIFSARVVPGHERSVNRVCDHLVRRGARVLTESDPPVHVSGHAHKDELRDWITAARPRAVLPIHGEHRMLAAAAEVAREAGVAAENVFLLDNGDSLTIEAGGFSLAREAVPSGRIYLDSRPEPVDSGIVRDRRELAQEGFVVVIVPPQASEEIAVASRGVAAPAGRLEEEIRRAARDVLSRATIEERRDPEWLRAEIALAARRACRRAFGLRPVIVPVVV